MIEDTHLSRINLKQDPDEFPRRDAEHIDIKATDQHLPCGGGVFGTSKAAHIRSNQVYQAKITNGEE